MQKIVGKNFKLNFHLEITDMGDLHENWVIETNQMTTNQAEEIGQSIISQIGESIASIEPTYDNIYIETESGKVYSVSIMECEE